MEITVTLFAVISLLATVFLIWYLIRWIFSKSERKPHFRKRFFLSGGALLVSFVIVGVVGGKLEERNAMAAGFDSYTDYMNAKRENVTDPDAWSKIIAEREAEAKARAEAEAAQAQLAAEAARKAAEEEAARVKAAAEAAEAERKAQEEAEAAKAEAARLAEEAACKSDLNCWGEKANIVAMFSCPRLIERMAKYDYEWTDGFLDVKFSHYRWKDIENGIVTVIGDKIKFQNGFGAWSPMIYQCDVDPVTKTVLDVRVSAGRL